MPGQIWGYSMPSPNLLESKSGMNTSNFFRFAKSLVIIIRDYMFEGNNKALLLLHGGLESTEKKMPGSDAPIS